MNIATRQASLQSVTVGAYGLRNAVIAPIRHTPRAPCAISHALRTAAHIHNSILGGTERKSRTLKAAAAAVPAPTPSDGPKEDGGPLGWLKQFDVKKLTILGFMFFISCFNYTILQSLKDALVVTQIGAEALPFLGAYGVFPGSVLFFMYYGWVTKKFPEKMHYYAALAPFLTFYAAFAFILFPLAPALHPTHLLESIKAVLPGGFVGLAGVVVNWLYSLFFVCGELWGGVAISMLFWGLADEVCTLQEAKDVYPALGMLANVGLICAGAWIKFVNGAFSAGDASASMRILVSTILATSTGLFFLKNVIDTKYLAEAHAKGEAEAAEKAKKRKGKKDKTKDPNAMSRAFDVLKKSPKVGNLAILVIAYFVVAKLFDFAWKAQLRNFYPSNTDFQMALASVSQLTGIATITLMATSRFLFQNLGWGGAAIIPPLAILVSGGVFFSSALVATNPGLVSADMAAWIIPIGAAAGIAGRVLAKSSKYSIFDPAKEMVFITMNKEEKTEGKASVDLLGSYFGKSGASITMQVLILTCGSLNSAMPIILAIHMIVCAAWTKSTLSLASLMKKEEESSSGSGVISVDMEPGTDLPSESTKPSEPILLSNVVDASSLRSMDDKGKGVKSMDGAPVPKILLHTAAGPVDVTRLHEDEIKALKLNVDKETGDLHGHVQTDRVSLQSTFSDEEA